MLYLFLNVFVHAALQNWEVLYQQDTPVAPRFDVNAPDLYIPAMGFITYVLVAGLALGTQNRYGSGAGKSLEAESEAERFLVRPAGFLQSCWGSRPAQHWCGSSWRCWRCCCRSTS